MIQGSLEEVQIKMFGLFGRSGSEDFAAELLKGHIKLRLISNLTLRDPEETEDQSGIILYRAG